MKSWPWDLVFPTGPSEIEFSGSSGNGGLSSVVVADEDLVIRTPENLSDQEAAATPEAFITAHDAFRQGQLAADETLLVTGATGNVGQAAVKIGLTRGARVFGLARSKGGVRLLQSLGAAGILTPPSREGMHSPELVNSVDVVVELVGACNARPNLVALRSAGRIVQIGSSGNENITFNLRDFKTKRAVMIGSTLRRRPRAAKASAVCAFSEEILPLVASGAIAPRIPRVFPAEEAQQAFEFMNTPAKYGKVMISF